MVIQWEERYNRYLGHIQENIRAGTARPDEVWQFENLERTVVIYDLMMKNIIEEKGTGPQEAQQMGPEKNLDWLVDRILPEQKYDRKLLESALARASANGNLECDNKDGRLTWKWQDYS